MNKQAVYEFWGDAVENLFESAKTILKTMQKVDQHHKMANYEFFREKAWQSLHCLKYYVDNVPYTSNGQYLSEKLRAVATELIRTANLLNDSEDDTIKVFDEIKGKIEINYDKLADKTFR